MDAALNAIVHAFYRTRNWDFGWKNGFGQYLLCKRPKSDLIPTLHSDDLVAGRAAVAAFLDLWPSYGASEFYRHDAIAVLVHLASLCIDRDLIDIMDGYRKGDIAAADSLWTNVQSQLADLDLIMGEQADTLSSWLTAAQRYGATAAESNYYVENARAQVTIWGGDNVLNDYASKAWQGLYDDFYRARWALFFERLRKDGAALNVAAMTQNLIDFDNAWVARLQIPAVRRSATPHALAKIILERIVA